MIPLAIVFGAWLVTFALLIRAYRGWARALKGWELAQNGWSRANTRTAASHARERKLLELLQQATGRS